MSARGGGGGVGYTAPPLMTHARLSSPTSPAWRRQAAIVVPAFETLNSSVPAPATKPELVAAISRGQVKPVHMHFMVSVCMRVGGQESLHFPNRRAPRHPPLP